jgi:hypothetical protein
MPSGMPGDSGTGGGSSALVDNYTYGRGGLAADENGIVELVSFASYSIHLFLDLIDFT